MIRDRVLFGQTVDTVRPAHLLAAARDVGVRVKTGPPGADPDRCEIILTCAYRKDSRIHPADDAAHVDSDFEVNATTFLCATFTPERASVVLRQVRLIQWLPGTLVLAFIGAFFSAAPAFMGDAPISGRIGSAVVGALFVLLAAYNAIVHVRSQRRDPRMLLRAWHRAVELAEIIDPKRLPTPAVPPVPGTPAWPEKRARRGWLMQRSICEGLSRETVEAAFSAANGDSNLYVWASADSDDLIIAAHPSKATFKHDPRWPGYLLLQHARMIIRFSATLAEMEIRVRRPYEGVVLALLFLAAGVYGVTRAAQEATLHGATALLVGVPFLVVGLSPTIGLWWRWRHIRRELAEMRRAWTQLCGERASGGEAQVR